MTNEWDEYAADWDDDPVARAYAAAAFDSLVHALSERGVTLDGLVVCDFGCGTGLLTEQLVDAAESIDAVDTSPAMLEVVEAKIARHGWREVGVGSTVPASRYSHDLVACSSVCSFLDDYPGTVRRLVELLGPGGVFVQWDWERDEADSEGHGLTRAEIEHAIGAAGLVNTHVGTAFEVEMAGETMRPLIGVGQKPTSNP